MSEVGAIFSCGSVSHAGNCATVKSLFHSFKACSKSSASRAFAVTANKTPSELFAMWLAITGNNELGLAIL